MSIPVELIERARSRDIRNVAEQLGAVLKKVAANEYCGPCPRCGGNDRFGVNIRKQVWNCRGCGAAGDVIGLVQQIEQIPFREAIERLAGEGLRKRVPRRTPPPAKQPADNNLDFAGVIWQETLPLGEEACAWLTRRGIDIFAVPELGALRRHPRCPWGGTKSPCIVARFTDAVIGEDRGIWRRRIDAPEKPRTLGPMAGCVIRLWPDEEVTLGLVIGEGIETVLAAATRIEHAGTLLQPAWATGGSGNLRTFPVLAGIEGLTILVDRDESGGGQRAAAVCAQRWLNAGVDVIRLTPRITGDFNDIVLREGGA